MYLFNFSDGLFRAKKNGYDSRQKKKKKDDLQPDLRDEWIYLDKNFNKVLSFYAFWAGDFHDGLVRVVYGDYTVFVDKTGREIVKIESGQIDWIDDFQDGYARVLFKDGTMGFFDMSGKIAYRTLSQSK